MKRLACLLLFALRACSAQPAFGQSVTLPDAITGVPGQWIVVAPIKTDGGAVKWRFDAGLQEVQLGQLLPEEYVSKLKGKVVTASRPGKYRVEAWNAKGDVASDIATVFVTIIGDVPVPPLPPVPPIPPVPVPIPSALQQALQAAYAAETDPQKAAQTAALADLLGSVVAAARASGKIVTAKDVQTTVKAATDIAIGPAAIPTVRRAVGAYLVTVLPTDPASIVDGPYWVAADREYGRVAAALRGVK